MTADLTAAFAESLRRLGRPMPTLPPRTWDGGVEGPEPDLFVSESEAAYRQRLVDDVLSELWGAA